LGDRRVRARCDAADLRVLAARAGGNVSVLLVNYGLPASRDAIATLRFAGLSAGRKHLTAWRIDRARNWSARGPGLRPVERRRVVTGADFSCQVSCPADSVCMVTLEAGE